MSVDAFDCHGQGGVNATGPWWVEARMLLITFQVLNTEVSGSKVNSAGGRGLCPRLIWATKFCETPEKDTPSLLREPQKHVPFSPRMKEGPSHRLDPVPHAKL